MDVEQSVVGDVVVLSVRGDITMDGGASRVGAAIGQTLETGHTQLLLDLGHVRHVDSAGLGELVQAFTAARHQGGALKLLHVADRLNDLLIVTRLLTVFECFDREAEAIESFSHDHQRLVAAAAAESPVPALAR